MVTIPTVDSRPLQCHTRYDKWTFPGIYKTLRRPTYISTQKALHLSLSLSHTHTHTQHPHNTHTHAHTHTPATETDKLKYAVFRDLWLKGYYLTAGLKYGGDYLVYRYDPNEVHSDFIAVVLPWQQPISSIVALGRLGSKVKKNTLLCSLEKESGQVKYITLQWSSIA